MSENTAEKQRISPLISLLLEFLDILRTCMHDHNSYLDPIRHFTSAGIGSPAETWTRVHLHVRSVADYTSGHHVRNHCTPFSRNTYPMAIKGSLKVRSWTVLPRINKVLHTDSLVCRIDWCQTRKQNPTLLLEFLTKKTQALCCSRRYVAMESAPCTVQDLKQKRPVILLKQLPLQYFSSEDNRKFKTIC